MKSSGAGLVWLSLTLIGLHSAVRLKKRTGFFSGVLNFIKALYVEMEYSASDLPEIIAKLSQSKLCCSLRFLKECVALVNSGVDFPKAWQYSVEKYGEFLKHDEQSELITLGVSLGTTDLSGQKRLLELFSEHINGFYNDAKHCEDKYYRIYILAGTLTGFGIFILLI